MTDLSNKVGETQGEAMLPSAKVKIWGKRGVYALPYRVQDTCRSCDGWGYRYVRTSKQPCRACNGTGLNQRKGA